MAKTKTKTYEAKVCIVVDATNAKQAQALVDLMLADGHSSANENWCSHGEVVSSVTTKLFEQVE